LPTASQEQQILATWGAVVPQPAFDFAYSWGIQENDSALVNTPSLQSVLAAHNAASTAAAKPSLAAASSSVTDTVAAPLVAPAAGAVSAATVVQLNLVQPLAPSLPADPGQPGSVTAPAAGPVPSAGGVTGAVLPQVAGQQASLATGAQDGADGAGPDLGGTPDLLGPGELGLDGLLARAPDRVRQRPRGVIG
jgi:hypothetical protein